MIKDHGDEGSEAIQALVYHTAQATESSQSQGSKDNVGSSEGALVIVTGACFGTGAGGVGAHGKDECCEPEGSKCEHGEGGGAQAVPDGSVPQDKEDDKDICNGLDNTSVYQSVCATEGAG